MIQACIFDLDGTLLDTEIVWVEAVERYLREHDPTLERRYVLQLVYGRSWHDIYRDIRARFTELDLGLFEMQMALKPHFERLKRDIDIRIDGSITLLRRLAARLPICIVSGSPRSEIEDGIELMGIGDALAFHLGAEDYTPGKPDPAGFLMAARRFRLSPSTCIVFEDSAAGTAAARHAGMWCVGLARPNRPAQDLSPAHLILPDLAEFDLDAFVVSQVAPSVA